MSRQLRIHTFGRFQISDGENDFTDATSNKSKVWSVLKYLIAYYGKPVSADRLADILWSEEEYDDPGKLLRDIIYRLRKTLTTYGGDQQYITFSQGNYTWNPDIDCWIDFLEFDELLSSARDDTKSVPERMALYNSAVDMYNGPFLRDSAVEIWTLTFTDFYRRLFLQAVNELADLYETEYMLDEIVMVFDKAIAIEPYEEPMYIRQIQTLIGNGEYAHARQQYRQFEKILLREFGTKPSHNLERLSFEIDKATINQNGSFEEITQILESGAKKQGAFFCGPETFRQIYNLDKRSEERVNFPVYLVLITYNVPQDTPEDKKDSELKSAMKALRQVLLQSLRNGDIVAQYSKSQFVLMLTVLGNDGGTAAMHRIRFLFEKKVGKDKGLFDYNLSPIGRDEIGIGTGTSV